MNVCLVDAGNTRIKWALWNTDRPVGEWRACGDVATDDPAALRPALESAGMAGVARAAFCSVASGPTSDGIEAALRACGVGLPSRFRSLAEFGPLANGYERPGQLGADRFAAALGAWNRVRGDAVVVGAGTATTIDLVRAARQERAVFAGGLILPGLDLMVASLAKNTAGLPLAAGSYQPVPGNTDDAIISGCLNAQVGAIEQMLRIAPARAVLVLTGGAAPRLLPRLERAVMHVPALVLEGLAVAILQGL